MTKLIATVSFALAACSFSAFASMDHSLTTTADQVTKDEKAKTTTLIGHAAVKQATYTVTAEKIVITTDAKTITATGDVIYTDEGTIKRGEEMTFSIGDGKWVEKTSTTKN